jgi:hypothetical protein
MIPAIAPGRICGVFLRRMMRKRHRHDKRLSPQGGLQERHAAPAAALIPRNGVLRGFAGI